MSLNQVTHERFSQPSDLSSAKLRLSEITNPNGGSEERVHLMRKPRGIQVALCVSRRLKSFPISALHYHAPADSRARNPAGIPFLAASTLAFALNCLTVLSADDSCAVNRIAGLKKRVV